MVRRESMETNETVRAIAGLQVEKAQIRAEIRQALAAWKIAQKTMTYATDREGRVYDVGKRLHEKIAQMNGRVSEINATIAHYRGVHKERARRYAAETDAARGMRRAERERDPFLDERA